MTDQKIFRYKFAEETIQIIYQFSKVHQFDDRETFKEAWNKWLIDNEEQIQSEKRRLLDLGYEGNIDKKLYISSRYYYRNKQVGKQEPKKRRKYISCDHDFLELMDLHIEGNCKKEQMKPAVGFEKFCNEHKEEFDNQVLKYVDFEKEMILAKIKKTYKNRYFQFIKNI